MFATPVMCLTHPSKPLWLLQLYITHKPRSIVPKLPYISLSKTTAVMSTLSGCCSHALQAFAKGLGPFVEAVMEHDFIHAAKLTLMLAAIAVPLNTIFGTVAAILITRNEFPGKVRTRASRNLGL